MTIESPQRLRNLLSGMSSLGEDDRNVMLDTARFLPDGRLGTLYLRIMMQKCPFSEIDQFFRLANAYMQMADGRRYGARDGDQVYFHYRDTGREDIPCEPQEWASCWVSANNPWRPDINRPFPSFR